MRIAIGVVETCVVSSKHRIPEPARVWSISGCDRPGALFALQGPCDEFKPKTTQESQSNGSLCSEHHLRQHLPLGQR